VIDTCLLNLKEMVHIYEQSWLDNRLLSGLAVNLSDEPSY